MSNRLSSLGNGNITVGGGGPPRVEEKKGREQKQDMGKRGKDFD